MALPVGTTAVVLLCAYEFKREWDLSQKQWKTESNGSMLAGDEEGKTPFERLIKLLQSDAKFRSGFVPGGAAADEPEVSLKGAPDLPTAVPLLSHPEADSLSTVAGGQMVPTVDVGGRLLDADQQAEETPPQQQQQVHIPIPISIQKTQRHAKEGPSDAKVVMPDREAMYYGAGDAQGRRRQDREVLGGHGTRPEITAAEPFSDLRRTSDEVSVEEVARDRRRVEEEDKGVEDKHVPEEEDKGVEDKHVPGEEDKGVQDKHVYIQDRVQDKHVAIEEERVEDKHVEMVEEEKEVVVKDVPEEEVKVLMEQQTAFVGIPTTNSRAKKMVEMLQIPETVDEPVLAVPSSAFVGEEVGSAEETWTATDTEKGGKGGTGFDRIAPLPDFETASVRAALAGLEDPLRKKTRKEGRRLDYGDEGVVTPSLRAPPPTPVVPPSVFQSASEYFTDTLAEIARETAALGGKKSGHDEVVDSAEMEKQRGLREGLMWRGTNGIPAHPTKLVIPMNDTELETSKKTERRGFAAASEKIKTSVMAERREGKVVSGEEGEVPECSREKQLADVEGRERVTEERTSPSKKAPKKRRGFGRIAAIVIAIAAVALFAASRARRR
ncbi:hypothetical protein CBR_g21132 [Chara braunii]|uniref:Uncharacterized protein n=1 Tax=Chara braunii TaxID=69332 RepID=A0A388L0Q8_CHABU|nr:hypothetical protein CBR_g21132 [Chara braunii]|eukprot:GBG75890.1 hypothetical protein CBR_g21132 [Chara braunii]